MYKNIDARTNNRITVVGKLIDVNIREGKTKKDGKPYRSGTAVVRVEQTYNGKNEVSEIPVNFIASKFKKNGEVNPAYDAITDLQTKFKSAVQVGIDNASLIRVNSRYATISENLFCSKRDPEKVNSVMRIDCNYFQEVYGNQMDSVPSNALSCATFEMDIFILAISPELNSEGEETGRIKIRGATVGYNKKIDVFDFYVESESAVDYIGRNYNVNDTVHVVGRIRYAAEVVNYTSQNTWGEDIPKTEQTFKKELIITSGNNDPLEEELAYDPKDIKILMADRSNYIEQLKIDARTNAVVSATTQPKTSDYDWE